MNKVVVKGLKLSDQGVWYTVKGVYIGELKGKEFALFGEPIPKRYFTHLWLARKFVKNPNDWKNVEIINPKKKLTAENVRWIKSHRQKLSHEDVLKLRAEYTKSGATVTQKQLAEKYGVCVSAISRILSGKRWT